MSPGVVELTPGIRSPQNPSISSTEPVTQSLLPSPFPSSLGARAASQSGLCTPYREPPLQLSRVWEAELPASSPLPPLYRGFLQRPVSTLAQGVCHTQPPLEMTKTLACELVPNLEPQLWHLQLCAFGLSLNPLCLSFPTCKVVPRVTCEGLVWP